jgi:cytochrome bd ubiquinol oxidase subunit I
MDVTLLARWQFGITTVYHFFFVPLTLGLSVIVAIMETIYVRTGKEVYRDMTKFWGKLFLINFAMGVVTGIVQEFQFGMNWSEYSRFVGDVFGAPLAIEALSAFFLESTFLGIWIFGWDKLSRGMHAAVMWLVAIGSNLSALWILIANSFMQEPVGYIVRNGRAEMADFFVLLTNPNIVVQFPHTVLAGFTTGSFLILGISAYHLLRKNHEDLFRRSFQIAAIFGLVSVLLLGLNGHSQAQHMVATQPMKMAAAEALCESENPASFSLITIGDCSQGREIFSIRIPYVLSLLSFNTLEGEVKGLNNLQMEFEQLYGTDNYIPPVAVIYWTFRFMVGAGSLMVLVAAYAVYLSFKDRLKKPPRFFKYFILAIFLPYIGNTTGWLMTEIGRSPWIVYGLMKINEGVSTMVSGGAVLFSLIGYSLVYALLMIVTIYLLIKFAKAGPSNWNETSEPEEIIPSFVGAQE